MKSTKTSTSKKSAQKLSKDKKAKKVSVKDIVSKAKDLLKKPFKRKPKRKTSEDQDQQLDRPLTLKEKTKQRISRKQKKALEDELLEPIDQHVPTEDEDQTSSSRDDLFAQASSDVNGFFYTNDKFFNRAEDDEILKCLQRSYPVFMRDPNDLTAQKKQILEMLQNAKFMEDFLSYYDMSIYDFFKYLFRIEPDIFKGSFLTRVQKAMRYKKYALDARKSTHFERKRARLKALQASQPKARRR